MKFKLRSRVIHAFGLLIVISLVSKSHSICQSFTVPDALKCTYLNIASSKRGAVCSASTQETGYECEKALDSEWNSRYRKAKNAPSVGQYIQVTFARKYLVNHVKLMQTADNAAQIKTVQLTFSDTSTETLSLRKNNGSAVDNAVMESFSFSARETNSIKITTTAVHSDAANTHGYKEIEVYHDTCWKDKLCGQVQAAPTVASRPFSVCGDHITFGVTSSSDARVLLSTSEAADSKSYELRIGQNGNTTTLLYRRDPTETLLVTKTTNLILSSTALQSFWIDYSTCDLTFGSGADIILKHTDTEAKRIKINYVSFRNGDFVICQRQDACYNSAKHFWPLDKVVGNAVVDLITSKRSIENPLIPLEVEPNFANPGPLSDVGNLATVAMNLSRYIDLGDFAGFCESNIAKCPNGTTVTFWFKAQVVSSPQVLLCSSKFSRGFCVTVDTNIIASFFDGFKQSRVQAPIRINTWHHVAITWRQDQGAMLLLDFTRKFVGHFVSAVARVDLNTHLVAGSYNDFSSTSSGLSVSYIAFWDTVLSSSQLQRIGRCSGLQSDLLSVDNGLSMHNGFIPDDAITASSSLDQYSGPERSRALLPTENGYSGGWRAATSDTEQYLQVDLLQPKVISRFIIQPRDCSCSDRVDEVYLSYSTSGATWRKFTESGTTKLFAVSESNCSLAGLDACPYGNLTARLLRVHPTSWTGQIALRMDIQASKHAVTYLGCYDLAPAPSTATSFDPNSLTTEKCITICGKSGLLYAALTGGDVCACTNTTPAAASRYGDGRCFEPCKGDFALKCGGTNYYSVYEVRGKFNFDYELTIPSRVSPFTDFNATVTSYEGASTFFDFGEGLSYWTSTASIKYVYRSVGHFQVVASTKLGEWGEPQTFLQKKWLVLMTSVGAIQTGNCPRFVEALTLVDCPIEIDAGSNMRINTTEPSGEESSVVVEDAWIDKAGQPLKFTSSKPAMAPNLSVSDTFLLPTLTFTHKGSLKAWEVNVSTSGFIVFQIWRPVCIAESEESYCYKGGNCTTATPPCPVYNASRNCPNPGVYCTSPSICATSNLLCPDVQTETANVSLNDDYEITHDTLAYVTSGVHIISANENNSSLPFPDVRAGDIVAIGIPVTKGAVLLSVPSVTQSYRYKGKTFAHGDTIRTSGNSDIESFSYLFAVNAYYTRPTIYIQATNYTVGLWERHLTVSNELGTSNYAYSVVATESIRNVTWDAPEGFPTNRTSCVTISPHAGYNITYNINFTNDTSQERFVTRANEPQIFCHIYTKEGEETITLLVTNDLSLIPLKCTLQIQNPIQEAGLYPLAPSVVGELTVIDWWAQGGSAVTANVTFGDGEEFSLYNTTFDIDRAVLVGSHNHTYTSDGAYNVTVLLFNKVSSILLHGLAIIEYRILGFTSVIFHKARDIEVNETITFKANVTQGSHPKLLIDYGDGHVDYLPTLIAQHAYSTWQFYLVNITVMNNVSSENTSSLIQVHKPVEPLVGFVISAFPSNVTSPAELSLEKVTGTDFTCDWKFGDGVTTRQNYSTSGETMFHTYPIVGTFLVKVNCSNRLYNTSVSTSIAVQEPITNLSLGIPMAHSMSEDLIVSLGVSAGTNITFEIAWSNLATGIGNSIVIAAGRTNSACCNWTAVVSKTNFPDPGKLKIEVSYWNLVTLKQTSVFTVEIEEFVSDLIVTNNDVYIPVGVPSNFQVMLSKGSNVTITYDFADKSIFTTNYTGKFPQAGVVTSHSWKDDGAYQVIISAANVISSCTVDKYVFVQFPVENLILLSNSPQILPPGIVTWWLSVQPSTNPPTNATFDFDYGDQQNDTQQPFGKTSNRTHSHNYTTHGVVAVNVTIRNEISSLTLLGSAEVQRAIKNLQALTLHTGGDAGVGNPGRGSNRDTFPYEYSVNHTANHTDGTNVTYTWGFGDGNRTLVTHSVTTLYRYKEEKNYTVTLIAENSVSREVVVTHVNLMKSCINITFMDDGPTIITQLTSFHGYIDQVGTESCYLFELGNKTYILYKSTTNTICQPEFNITDYYGFDVFILNGREMNFTFRYLHVLTYHIQMIASNVVSRLYVRGYVPIVTLPCRYPIVRLPDTGTKYDEQTPYFKSEEIVISSKCTVHCLASRSTLFYWQMLRVVDAQDNGTYYYPGNDAVTNKPNMVIPARSLDYGQYKACLNVSVIGYPYVSKVACSYIAVLPSPLKAMVYGGHAWQQSFARDTVLDASFSYDPDEGDKNTSNALGYSWFFRKKGQNFTFPTGNFSNFTEIGNLVKHIPGLLAFNGKVLTIPSGILKLNETYEFKLFIGKDTRISTYDVTIYIVDGLPPQMALVRPNNEKERVNPSSKTTIEAVCVTCNASDHRHIRLAWKLLKQNINNTDEWNILPNIDDYTLSNLAGRFLVIKPNVLEGGRKYKACITGTLPGRPQAFTELQIVVNKGPYGGNCSISPKSGRMLQDRFTLGCSGWLDDDGGERIVYKFSYKTKPDGIHHLLQYTTKNLISNVLLPMGNSVWNYKLQVTVEITDRDGGTSKFPLSVEVVDVDMSVEDYLSFLTAETKINGTLRTLEMEGYSQATNQFICAAGSWLDTSALNVDGLLTNLTTQLKILQLSEEVPEEEILKIQQQIQAERERLARLKDIRSNLRLKMSRTLDTIQFDRLETVQQTSASIGILAGEPTDEVPLDVQQNLFNVAEKLVDFAFKKSTTTDAFHLASVTNSEAFALGGLLQSSSYVTASSRTSNASSAENMTANARDLILNTVRLRDKVTDAFMEKLSVGEYPVQLGAETLALGFGKTYASDMNNVVTSCGAASFQHSSVMASFFEGRNLTSAVIEQTAVTTPFNHFAWNMSAELVHSFVTSLELSHSSSRTEISVANLREPIVIWVPKQGKTNCSLATLDFHDTRYHTFDVPRNASAINIEVRPSANQTNVQLKVFMKKGSRPSTVYAKINRTIPENITDPSDDPYVFLVSNEELNFTAAGTHFVAVMYADLLNMKVEGEDTPEEYLTINYTFCSYTAECLFWEENNEDWISDGCVVGPLSNSSHTQCLCNHLTNFASDFFVPPNSIDWNKINLKELLNNFVVTGVVLTIFGLYFIVLIWARREDKKDLAKIGLTPLPSNDPRDNYVYEIIVFTGYQSNAGTTSEISIVLSGRLEETAPRVLKETDLKRIKFAKGSVDSFLLTVPHPLGKLKSVQVWHNHSGKFPSWYLQRICVIDVQTGNKTWFIANRWFALEEDDGRIDRTLFPASRDDLTKFNLLFATETRRNFMDGHLWFSVYLRPARSTFTRMQRLTCCLTVLLTTMVANAMFYEAGTSSSPTTEVKIGPIRFSTQQISIAIISSLVVLPINTIVVMLFRKAKPAQNMDNMTSDPDGREHKYRLPDDWIDDEEDERVNESDMKKKKKDKKVKETKDPRTLPHWVVYVAYVAALLGCVVSAVFTIFYGLTFGKAKSERWISSTVISFWQDVVLMQPLKVVAMAVFFALIIKDPDKGDDDKPADLGKDEEWIHERYSDDDKLLWNNIGFVPKPPSEETLYHSRQFRTKKKRMVEVIKETFFYVVFILVLCIVAYGNLDTQAYPVRATVSDYFAESKYVGSMPISEVDDLFIFWEWVEHTFVPTLKPSYWYGPYTDPAENDLWTDAVQQQTRSKRRSRKLRTKAKGRAPSVINYVSADLKKYPKGFTADHATAYMVGAPRLRQLRVIDSCQVMPALERLFKSCTLYYTWDNEDEGAFVANWKPLNDSKQIERAKKSKDPWVWQSAWDLKGTPYWGQFASYWGGGFVANLGSARLGALKSMQLQELGDWIDRRTRALFAEFTVYNPYVNFFCVVSLLTEILPTGGYYHYNRVTPIRLYRYVGPDQMVIMAFEILYISFVFVFTYHEVKQLSTMGKKYFNDPWNYTEVLVIISSFCAIGLYFARMAFGKTAIDTMVENQEAFVSFDYVAILDDWCTAMIGFAVFCSFLKMLKILRFNKKMALMTRTVKACQNSLLSFFVLFLVVFLAYVQFAFLVFGPVSYSYSSLIRAVATLMSMTLGGFDFETLQSGNRILGPIFFFSYMMFVFLILVNVFLSIINDSFAEVSADAEKQTNDYEIIDFITLRIKHMIGVLRGPIIKPMYKPSKTKVEEDLDTLDTLSENIEYALRKIVLEELRQTNWLSEATSRKSILLRMMLETDIDFTEDDLSNAIPVIEKFATSFTDEELKELELKIRTKEIIVKEECDISGVNPGNCDPTDGNFEETSDSTDRVTLTGNAVDDDDEHNTDSACSSPAVIRSQSVKRQIHVTDIQRQRCHSIADIRTRDAESEEENAEETDSNVEEAPCSPVLELLSPPSIVVNRSYSTTKKTAEELHGRPRSASSTSTMSPIQGSWSPNALPTNSIDEPDHESITFNNPKDSEMSSVMPEKVLFSCNGKLHPIDRPPLPNIGSTRSPEELDSTLQSDLSIRSLEHVSENASQTTGIAEETSSRTPGEPNGRTPKERISRAPEEPYSRTPEEPSSRTPEEPSSGAPEEPRSRTPEAPSSGTREKYFVSYL